MKIKERMVHFYDLHLHTLSLDAGIKNPNQTNMSIILNELQKHIKKGHEIGTNKTVEVTDFKFNPSNSSLTLLLNRPDEDLSDVTYKDRKTKTRRNGNKLKTEAIEISSHIIITPKPNEPVAEVRMTMGAGVYADRITRFLNELYDTFSPNSKPLIALRTRAHPTQAVDKNNKPLTYQVKYRFEQTPHANAWLKDILSNGTVKGIELIENGNEEFDASHRHDITRKTIQIKTTNVKFDISSLKKLCGIAQENHNLIPDHLRIEYQSASGPDGVKLFSVNQLDAAFTKSIKIELDTDHNQHQSIISQEIIAKMLAIA